MVGGWRHGEVRMIQNIKEFRPELYVEVLRNLLNRVVLKHGEIQVRRPRPRQEVATGSASKVETRQRRQPRRREVAVVSSDRVSRIKWVETIPKGGWHWIAVRRPKRGARRG